MSKKKQIQIIFLKLKFKINLNKFNINLIKYSNNLFSKEI